MKQSCEHIEQMLFNKGMRGLSPLDRLRLNMHIARCGECREQYAFEKGLNDLFAGARIHDCPAEVREIIRRKTVGDKKSVRTLSRLFAVRRYTYVAIAAAAVVIMLMFHPVNTGNRGGTMQYTPEQVALARKQAEWSLAYAGSVLNKTNRRAVEDALLEQVPESIKASIEKSFQIF